MIDFSSIRYFVKTFSYETRSESTTMGICYSDTSEPFSGNFDVSKLNGTKQYLKHYANLLYLSFIAKTTKDGRERRQAEGEIATAEKKLSYWSKHPNYVHADAVRGVSELKKQWSAK